MTDVNDAPPSTNPAEVAFRRRWFATHAERFRKDEGAVQRHERALAGFRASAPAALDALETLRRTGDLEQFRSTLQAWATQPGTLAFNDISGQKMVNSLVKHAADDRLVALLTEGLEAPTDQAEARAKLEAITTYVESVRVGAHPAPGHLPFLFSYFWALQDHGLWPVFWKGASNWFELSTGTPLPSAPADRYLRFVHLVKELDVQTDEVEAVASWWDITRPVLLDEVICERAAFNSDTDHPLTARNDNANALVALAGYLGTQLADELAPMVGRSLKPKQPTPHWGENAPRADFWADWLVAGTRTLAIRIWVNESGAAIGLRISNERAGWLEEAHEVITRTPVPGLELLAGRGAQYGRKVGLYGSSGEYTLGRWFDKQALAALDLRRTIVEIVRSLRPVIDELTARITGEVTAAPADDQLAAAVARFKTSRGYPTPRDQQKIAERTPLATTLARDNVRFMSAEDLRAVYATPRYGSPGPQANLSSFLRDADAVEFDRLVETVEYLVWGDEPDEDRIDAVLDDLRYRVPGLRESVALKFLAVAHPDRYVPIYPYNGEKGKRRMLQRLGLAEPTGSTGTVHVRSNDLLRSRLDRYFPGDPWGIAQFLYWYDEQPPGDAALVAGGGTDTDELADLATELLVDRSFLEDIVELLEDKGQVILYGPPGTGKTYLARKLAERLVPDANRRTLVQFHPSTSYEDFFEGYRPELVDGQLTYRLTPGPLARMAAKALDAPGKRHLMIIDEINRANLPKVFGELLFLLEYRDEQVPTLYRPDDPFELPHDLWFIGTMNTADRSIALVDAALRRRFHFIPVFPQDAENDGILDRWLQREREPGWAGQLVSMVNQELTEALGGPHLQLGASYFMQKGLDENRLRRIWKYNIDPFIEDQFFGDQHQIARFRFEAVLGRFHERQGRPATTGATADDVDQPAAE